MEELGWFGGSCGADPPVSPGQCSLCWLHFAPRAVVAVQEALGEAGRALAQRRIHSWGFCSWLQGMAGFAAHIHESHLLPQRTCEEPVGISLPDARGGADAFSSLSCPLASKGLANTAVFGKLKPSTSRCSLDFFTQEREGLGLGYFVFCFHSFWKKRKRHWLFFIQIPLQGEGAGREKQHGLLHV